MWGAVGNHRIFCLITQDPSKNHDHPGRATIENVNHCLRELSHRVDKEKITSLALPRLATGVGGLEWAEVEKQIKHHLGALKIPVYVYATYKKGIAAEEKGLPPAQKSAH